ncbi:MAG: hypothetical protein IJV76_01795 [Clostridia bacterium]|nr:hypothetical protein [Clostridia bacterium]
MEREENIFRLVDNNVFVNRVMNTCNAIAAFCEKGGNMDTVYEYQKQRGTLIGIEKYLEEKMRTWKNNAEILMDGKPSM